MSDYSKMTHPEAEVSSFLTLLGLKWRYEYPLFVYDDRDKPRVDIGR